MIPDFYQVIFEIIKKAKNLNSLVLFNCDINLE
jgi:hypothetical protein